MPRLWGKKLTADCPNQRQEGARFALLTFTAVNLLNFADRYVPSSVKPLLKEDLHLSDTETSLPVTGMVLVYMVFAVLFGWLADKNIIDRRLILSGAVLFWSLATALAGLAQNIVQLVIFRSLVGVGEAAYMSIVPPMISDFYPKADRNLAYMVFSLAMPVGGALGYVVGAGLGAVIGWREAFFAVGAPGVVVSLLLLRCNDPVRGINDTLPTTVEDNVEDEVEEEESAGNLLDDLVLIFTNKAYVAATAGMVGITFGIGAFADWYDVLLVRHTDTTVAEAGIVLGIATAVGGIGGAFLGVKTTQCLESRVKSAHFLVPALFMLPGTALACAAVNLVDLKYVAFISLVLCEVCLFTYTSPLTTVSVSVMPVRLRALSSGLQIFCTHVLGDVISPPIVGLISDSTGSLQVGLQVAWAAVLVAFVAWMCGYAFLPALAISGGKAEESSSFASLFCGHRPGDDKFSATESESCESNSSCSEEGEDGCVA